MDNTNLINRCITLIEGGYANELEEAVRRIEESAQDEVDCGVCNAVGALDDDDSVFAVVGNPDEDSDGNSDEISEGSLSGSSRPLDIPFLISRPLDIPFLMKSIHHVGNPWNVTMLPTLYGTVALVQNTTPGTNFDEFLACIPENMHHHPVFFVSEDIICDAACKRENADALMVYFADDDTQMDWLPADIDTVRTIRYVIPIDTEAIIEATGFGGAACACVSDVIDVLESANEDGTLDFKMPKIGWKITKPGMTCRGVQYALGQWYVYDGETPIELHKHGCHYATDPKLLFSWYRPFDDDNEVYMVQIGPNHIDGSRASVTDRMLFLERIQWSEI